MNRELPERPSPSGAIKDLLAQVLKQYGLGSDPRLRRVVAAWRQAAGNEYFEQTQVVAFKEGVVTVQVESAPLLQELAVYHKRALLAALKRSEASIVDVKFRPSARTGPPKAGSPSLQASARLGESADRPESPAPPRPGRAYGTRRDGPSDRRPRRSY